jgi:hypothetical protein
MCSHRIAEHHMCSWYEGIIRVLTAIAQMTIKVPTKASVNRPSTIEPIDPSVKPENTP